MDLSEMDQPVICLYCETYQKISSDYPTNPATFRADSEVPRCSFHSQYDCHSCGKQRHFNGVAWCHDCKIFTCLRCGDHRVTKQDFLVYDYYYSITCSDCEMIRPTLDYAECSASHPYQLGDLRPKGNLLVWLPFAENIPYDPEVKAWGNKKLRSMTIDVEFEPVKEVAGDSKAVWDFNAEQWAGTISNDVNHLEMIIPKMLEFMNPEQKIVMDVACGEGQFTRFVADAGYEVTAVDVSNLVDFAREIETKEPKGITYHKVSVHYLQEHFAENNFDQVTCNMAMMDMDNLDKIFENIAYILKPGGQLVFSITHPILAWPVTKTIKLPRDSEHNEDKGWLVDNYLAEQPVKVHGSQLDGPWLYYPRMISTYVNTLLDHGFIVTRLSEPEPDMETVMNYPRDMYRDYDRNPIFMVFQTKLEG